MSNRNNFSRRGGKYRQRGSRKGYYLESSRRNNYTTGDSVDTLMEAIDRTFKSSENSSSYNRQTDQAHQRNRNNYETKKFQRNQRAWWRVTIQDAGKIGKERVLSTLKVHCPHPFQSYHYFIDSNTNDGIFFVNNQNDADMIKRANGKIEVQNIEILRIQVNRVPNPISKIDADLRPYLKDHLLNRRFNQQTLQLDLSNLADDEELSTLGIFPQFNKHVFMSEIIDIINKELPMTRQLDFGSNNIMNLSEFRNLHLNNLTQLSFASNQLKNVDDFDNLNHLSQLVHIFIKNNPLTLTNNKQNSSIDDVIRSDLKSFSSFMDIYRRQRQKESIFIRRMSYDSFWFFFYIFFFVLNKSFDFAEVNNIVN